MMATAVARAGGGRSLVASVGWPTVHARRVRGADRRRIGVRRVRRARQPGAAPVDLAGLEVVYATSSGSTVTRKATWANPTILDPGKRVLLANASGVYAAVADATYSGGFAATGGAVAIRVVGGAAVDAIGWGMRRTRSSRGLPLRRRRRGRASSARPAEPPGTGRTRTTTPRTGSCSRRRRRRVSGRRGSPDRLRRPRL